jgi:hypothetical protein
MKHPRAGLRVRLAPRRASMGVVLAGVKAKPSGWPPASLDPSCGRAPNSKRTESEPKGKIHKVHVSTVPGDCRQDRAPGQPVATSAGLRGSPRTGPQRRRMPATGRGRNRPITGPLCSHPDKWAQYRENLTVFDSNGVAFEDHLALDVILQAAEQLGLGTKVSIESHPDDVLDPYSIRGHVPATPSDLLGPRCRPGAVTPS